MLIPMNLPGAPVVNACSQSGLHSINTLHFLPKVFKILHHESQSVTNSQGGVQQSGLLSINTLFFPQNFSKIPPEFPTSQNIEWPQGWPFSYTIKNQH
jgi:hypothetical protein